MYKYILLDLDGTVTDSGNAICSSVRYALNKYNITDPEPETLRKFIGPPLVDSFEEFFGFSKEDAIQATKYYRENYERGGMFEVAIYPGIPEMLDKLHENGAVVVLATSKPEKYAKMILDHFGLLTKFDMVAGATMDEKRNKKHQVIAYALEKLGVTDKAQAVMVGDTHFDVLGAADNGIACVGVSYGFGTLEELKEAGVVDIAGDAAQLTEKLL